MKRKQIKKSRINDDERWKVYDELRKKGEIFKAKKIKEQIFDSHIYKKPCHHMST